MVIGSIIIILLLNFGWTAVKFVTSCKEADIAENVKDILKHIFESTDK